MVRALDCRSRGCGFESRRPRFFKRGKIRLIRLFSTRSQPSPIPCRVRNMPGFCTSSVPLIELDSWYRWCRIARAEPGEYVAVHLQLGVASDQLGAPRKANSAAWLGWLPKSWTSAFRSSENPSSSISICDIETVGHVPAASTLPCRANYVRVSGHSVMFVEPHMRLNAFQGHAKHGAKRSGG